MANEIVLKMVDISKEFPGVKALNHVNFEARSGELLALMGENGAGKSTLMKVLSGVWPHPTYTGDIFVKGEKKQFVVWHLTARILLIRFQWFSWAGNLIIGT